MAALPLLEQSQARPAPRPQAPGGRLGPSLPIRMRLLIAPRPGNAVTRLLAPALAFNTAGLRVTLQVQAVALPWALRARRSTSSQRGITSGGA